MHICIPGLVCCLILILRPFTRKRYVDRQSKLAAARAGRPRDIGNDRLAPEVLNRPVLAIYRKLSSCLNILYCLTPRPGERRTVHTTSFSPSGRPQNTLFKQWPGDCHAPTGFGKNKRALLYSEFCGAERGGVADVGVGGGRFPFDLSYMTCGNGRLSMNLHILLGRERRKIKYNNSINQ
jgi:hypothetical protein